MEPVVFITGASDGIGRGLALEFARRGYRLGLLARRPENLTKVVSECLRNGSPRAQLQTVDVTDSASLRQALAALEEELGPVRIFIANAGIVGPESIRKDNGPVALRTIAVNFSAAVDGIEWAKARMIERGAGGRIVGVGSIAAVRGLPTGGVYSATKAALHSYLEALRVDLKSHRVSVTTVAPGFIDTAMTRKNRFWMPFLSSVEKTSATFVEGIEAGKRTVIAPAPWIPIAWSLRRVPDWMWDLAARAGAPQTNRIE